jgi:hypothetical protein
MTIPINMTLYRLLLKMGAEEAEAEAAASVDASQLATKADLAELKASLLMWIVAMFIGQTALLLTVVRMMLP